MLRHRHDTDKFPSVVRSASQRRPRPKLASPVKPSPTQRSPGRSRPMQSGQLSSLECPADGVRLSRAAGSGSERRSTRQTGIGSISAVLLARLLRSLESSAQAQKRPDICQLDPGLLEPRNAMRCSQQSKDVERARLIEWHAVEYECKCRCKCSVAGCRLQQVHLQVQQARCGAVQSRLVHT